MKTLLTVRNILLAIPVIILLAALHYALPQVDVVRAVGVEIKRIDAKDADAGQTTTRDVYQLQMETPGGSPRVYRNEDNMLYFKFDSANLQAQIQSAAADKQLMAVRHYGWRLTLFSAFPNAVKAWPVEEGYRHIPIFNTIVLLGLAAIFFLVYRRASKAVAATRQLVETKRLEREAAAAQAAQAPKERENEAKRKEQEEIDAFINNDQSNKN
ncbi:MAG: DUF1523 family protein [Granulosicoccus sp.]